MPRDTGIDDYLGFLRELGATGNAYFLEGGQAVNFWAEYFSAKGAAAALEPHRPFASKDCDLWVSHAALLHLEGKSDLGKLVKGRSPADGQVGLFTLNGPASLRIDLLSHVYGFPQEKLPRLLDRIVEVAGIKVIDPILLFQSKCHCLVGLDQTDRQDEKHLRILCRILPEHISEALDDVRCGAATERALVNEIKLLLDVLKTHRVRRALRIVEVETATLIPWETLKTCGLKKVERFAASIAGAIP